MVHHVFDPVCLGRWEIEDMPGVDENGDFGLVTKMRTTRPKGRWRDYDAAVLAADNYLTSGRSVLDQDVWWTGSDGLTVLIDDLTDDRRRFIARMLTDRAAIWHYRNRHHDLISGYWSFFAHAMDKGWGIEEDQPDARKVRDVVRGEQSEGKHLAWMRDTPLFRRMVRDLDWTHPGVTGTALDLGHPQRPVTRLPSWSDLPEEF